MEDCRAQIGQEVVDPYTDKTKGNTHPSEFATTPENGGDDNKLITGNTVELKLKKTVVRCTTMSLTTSDENKETKKK